MGNLHIRVKSLVMSRRDQCWALYCLIFIAPQVNSSILQFADDLKMFHVIRNAADFHQLQQDISSLGK